ncbi:uncharacterized protein LOC117302652 [Asterias rubens]|uniref:uncharacterized protein LOC117302652 n=1 Tax=Asterias rubens TaxID=7604 RepID=UPI00145566FB|nr:uncharacterized protein LOC117302652 [Asterias rubens]
MKLGRNAPCSRQCDMHYSFDFGQQLHYPSNPVQPSPLYFLQPRKCSLFGVCCEGVPQQINYLIDEGTASSHSRLGEESLSLHCDNCAGQNKSSPDWCFGLLKQKLRQSPVSCLQDIACLTKQSTASEVNLAQLVGSEAQEVYVPLYDWQSFLSEYFVPLIGFKKFHQFRFLQRNPVWFMRLNPQQIKSKNSISSVRQTRCHLWSCPSRHHPLDLTQDASGIYMKR